MKNFKWFKKKKQEEDVYAKMGRLGIHPADMLRYQDSVNKIKKFEISENEVEKDKY